MLTALLLLACSGAHTVPDASPVAEPATALPAGSRGGGEGSTVSAPTEGAPAGTDGIRGILLAHHTDDLPDRATLEKHPDPVASLAWLARNDDTLVVRERALASLGLWTGDATAAAACADVLQSTAPAGARAAAASCLGNQALATDEALRAVVLTALRDPDPRVGSAAALALSGVMAARAELEAASTDASLPEETREAAAQALRYR